MTSRHESSVNFENLIRDLADMYPHEVHEVVVVELIANALDAKADRIAIDYDPSSKVLTVTDNGEGMDAEQFAQYHDFAAGLKRRGSGIGFAGVGAKISFNAADRVITQTRGQHFTGGSDWCLEPNGKLYWYEIDTTDLANHGTKVEVHFRTDAAPSYATRGDIITLLQRNYLPLLDARFLQLYEYLSLYSPSLRFVVNGHVYAPSDIAGDFIQEAKKEFFPEGSTGTRIGFGVLGLAGSEYPLGEDLAGILLCTHGKVIKSDLFNQYPGAFGPKVFGVVEVPAFIDFITTSKTDFNRGRGRNREFERLYRPLREEFQAWLSGLGVQPEEPQDSREAARLERELRQLAESVPELSEFFGFRHRGRVLQPDESGDVPIDEQEGTEPTFPTGEGEQGDGPGIPEPGEEEGTAPIENPEGGQERANPITRRRRSGPRIGFESRPDRVDLAWAEGDTIYVNSGHPAYQRANTSAATRRIHCIFAIAGAVQKFLVDPDSPHDLMFVDRMMSAWGGR